MAPAGAMLFAISANDIALFAKGYMNSMRNDIAMKSSRPKSERALTRSNRAEVQTNG